MFKEILRNKAKIIESTDPNRIYVENVRSFFNIPTRWAKKLCEIAVRQNIFKKKYAVICKNSDCDRVIKVYDKKSEIPKNINCLTCELEAKEIFEFETDELEIIEYYQLIEK
jgi:hypothetical protein